MAKKGICVICGNPGKLTRDHVPPKGTNAPRDVDVRTLGEYLGSDFTKVRRLLGGFEVPSICGACNNVRLGQQYDPELKSFTAEVALWVRASIEEGLILPPVPTFRCRPVRILKAIMGHLLAAERRADRHAAPRDAPMIRTMREFFLDFDACLPSTFEVFAWPYSSHLVVICNGMGFVQPGGATLVCDVLKFFPLAFLIAFGRPATIRVNLPRLNIPSGLGPRDVVELEVDFRARIRVDWPEQPDQEDMILFNDAMTIIAEPRRSIHTGGRLTSG